MSRVKNAVASRRRRKKILKQVKGARGERSKRLRRAKETLTKGLTYAYRDRKAKKRQYRSLWIVRINAAARQRGLTYRDFMSGLKKSGVALSRDILSQIAVEEPKVFDKLAEIAKKAK